MYLHTNMQGDGTKYSYCDGCKWVDVAQERREAVKEAMTAEGMGEVVDLMKRQAQIEVLREMESKAGGGGSWRRWIVQKIAWLEEKA
jgi:hypothetical protein